MPRGPRAIHFRPVESRGPVPSLLSGGGGNAAILRVMILTQRLLAAAAAGVALCAGTSCDQEPAGGKPAVKAEAVIQMESPRKKSVSAGPLSDRDGLNTPPKRSHDGTQSGGLSVVEAMIREEKAAKEKELIEAEPLFRRALIITEESLGKEHTEVIVCLNNLAGLLQRTNRPEVRAACGLPLAVEMQQVEVAA